MGQKEKNLQIQTESKLTPWQRLWRVNAGQGWVGRILESRSDYIKISYPQPFYGMPKGTPDMIGFDSIIITPDMVGKRVAVFVGEELKATEKDKLKPKQINFKNLIVEMGGIHRETRPEETKETGFNCD